MHRCLCKQVPIPLLKPECHLVSRPSFRLVVVCLLSVLKDHGQTDIFVPPSRWSAISRSLWLRQSAEPQLNHGWPSAPRPKEHDLSKLIWVKINKNVHIWAGWSGFLCSDLWDCYSREPLHCATLCSSRSRQSKRVVIWLKSTGV